MQLTCPHIHIAKRQLFLALRNEHPGKPTRHHPDATRVPTEVDNHSLCIRMFENRFANLRHKRCQQPNIEANDENVTFDDGGLQRCWNIGQIPKGCCLAWGLNTSDVNIHQLVTGITEGVLHRGANRALGYLPGDGCNHNVRHPDALLDREDFLQAVTNGCVANLVDDPASLYASLCRR